jgi:hypothetical protein
MSKYRIKVHYNFIEHLFRTPRDRRILYGGVDSIGED